MNTRIMNRNLLIIGCICLIWTSFVSAQMTQPYTKSTVLLKNATLHTITQGDIVGDLKISGDTIAAIGTDLAASPGDSIIDATGKHIYPGFIDAGTSVGMREVGSVSLTIDTRELGNFTPHMRALTAVNPNSTHIPITRVNGLTHVIILPSGGVLPGSAHLIQLFGYNPDQMDAGFAGVVLNFPSKPVPFGVESDKRRQQRYEENLKNLDAFWKEAVEYEKLWSLPDSVRPLVQKSPQLHAMVPVLNKQTKLLINANRADDILAVIKWLEKKDLDVILMGVNEGWRVAEKIAEANLSVILGPVLSMPTKSSDRYDMAYRNAAMMAQEGVQIALRTNESSNARNLPFNAGFAATYGLGKEEALKTITINPARMFGLEEELGSLEVGKKASLFVSDGDPFETQTTIEHLFISGWKIPLESRQTQLYDEFLERNPGVDK